MSASSEGGAGVGGGAVGGVGGSTATTAAAVAAKITHVKNDGLSLPTGSISITGASMGAGTILTSSGIKTSLSGQATTSSASIRAIGAGNPSTTQVRVVMPTIKQLDNGRTQIIGLPAAPARSVPNASITVTRPVSQANYLPRASVTATQMSGGVGQRLVTPLRATSSISAAVSSSSVASVTPSSAGGLTTAGSFVRSAAVSRSGAVGCLSQPSSTVISSANSAATAAAWMQGASGQVQLIRAIHQPRQRIISTAGGAQLSGGLGPGVSSVSGSIMTTTATSVQTPGGATALSVTSHAPQPGSGAAPQAYVATVLPPRQHQTLVYSPNVANVGATLPNSNINNVAGVAGQPQFNPGVAAAQRFAVATPTTPTGTTVTPRQVRPIPLGKSFPAAKLNTTSISIRAPSLPQLSGSVAPPTPVSVSAVSTANRSAVGGGGGSAVSVAPVQLTAQLPTTRIIQLQQPSSGPGGQQIIGSSRLAGNVMLQPFLMTTTATAKMVIRPPVTMTAKVQPSLTITQLNTLGKLPTSATPTTLTPQGVASIQALPAGNVVASSISSSVAGQGGVVSGGNAAQQLLPSAAGGATLAISTRGAGPGGNILHGTLTPIKNASGITVGKMMMTQSAASTESAAPPNATPTSVFIQQRAAGAAVSTSSATAGGAFLPPGSAIYYESMPAQSSVQQVSTGVLSLTTTTLTQSHTTHSQAQAQAQLHAQQLVSSAGGSLSVSSLPFASPSTTGGGAGGSTATFTVLPSNARQQLIIPNPAGGANAAGQATGGMVIPLHTSVKVTTTSSATGGGATVSALPLPMSVPVSSFMRKRDADGSPIRAAKNLAPTLLSMSSSGNNNVATSTTLTAVQLPAGSSISAPYSLQPVAVPVSSSCSSLTVEALARKERLSSASAAAVAAAAAATAVAAAAMSSTRIMRGDSPDSSDGSTTVSANSSPGVEQQMLDSNLVINRIGDAPSLAAVGSGARIGGVGSDNATHFNPINELYASHHSLQSSITHTPISTRPAAYEAQAQQHQQSPVLPPHLQQQAGLAGGAPMSRLNGSVIASGSHSHISYDCSVRKKQRRSTNDSQHSTQSQASLSLSLPPPMAVGGIDVYMQQQQQHSSSGINNNGLLLAAANATQTTIGGDSIIHRPAIVGNKENANPVDFVLRRPRNCAQLNTYKPTHKLANNHFHRYTDVKPREERPATVIDLANQPNVQGKINGWKIYHLRSQMEDLNESELVSLGKLETMLKELDKDREKPSELERVSELLKGNIQRSKIITDGINDAQNQIMKIFEHKPHVSDIINRCASKRNFKKREKI